MRQRSKCPRAQTQGEFVLSVALRRLNFGELRKHEVRRIPPPRTRVNKGKKKDKNPGSLRRPRAPATSARIVVEPASALDPETPLVSVLAQQLTGTFRDAIAHGGVVLLYGQHDVQADAVH